MAEKEIKKTVQKGSTGKKRRLKRSVRKSLGALSLAAAIAVAAIPTDGLRAETRTQEQDEKGQWGILEKEKSYIPEIAKDTKLYTTGDGTYQFAYYQDGGDYVAVVLGYSARNLQNNALEIPRTVDAYQNISANLGTTGGYTAVSKGNEFLYYPVYTWVEKQTEQKNPDGTPVMTREIDPDKTVYYPCYFSNINSWYNYGDEPDKVAGEERSLEDYWYYPNNDNEQTITQVGKDATHQWMKNLELRYIGNQKIVTTEEQGGNSWKVADKIAEGSEGVFAGNGNIVSLLTHETLYGIGDYAFYSCTGLSSITLGNGLKAIGNGAFARCSNMSSVNLEVNSNVTVLGSHAFYDCIALGSFTLPVNVTEIGESAFENCTSLVSFNTKPVTAEGMQNANLNTLGAHAFRNCSSLTSISIPTLYTSEIPICTFAGCSSLKFIETMNSMVNFVPGKDNCDDKLDPPGEDNDQYDFKDFRKDVPAEFYFRGADRQAENSNLHSTAKNNDIPFSFYSSIHEKDVYEKSVTEENGDKAVYQVDEDNNLVGCEMTKGMETVTLPESIGPKHITTIGASTFQNNCFLKTITIPASIASIDSSAFKGCHDLKTVFFANGANPTIGRGAFKTQEVLSVAQEGCDNHTSLGTKPELNFVGKISAASNPFIYAMSEDENINADGQERTYIKYYSGWPENLVVQYNLEKHESELIDYPTLDDLEKYSKDKFPYITQNLATSAGEAVRKYKENIAKGPDENAYEGMDEYERQVIEATVNLVLPDGIESIKENLFATKEQADSANPNLEKTITAKSLKEIDDSAFKNHPNLVSITFSDATTSVGSYAFEGCDELRAVSLPATVSSLGIRPFAGCKKLKSVNFNGGPYFICDNSIVYESSSDNPKNKLVEVLEGRESSVISPEETAGVTEIYAEAFKNVDSLVTVDLSNSEIAGIDTETFADMDILTRVNLPRTIRMIKANAFNNDPLLRIVQIPGENCTIDNDAFGDIAKNNLELWVEESSAADWFGENNGIRRQYIDAPLPTFKVSFYDSEGLLSEQTIEKGASAIEPGKTDEIPGPREKEGYVFVGWSNEDWKCVLDRVMVDAVYEREDEIYYYITFYDWNASVLYGGPQEVRRGRDVIIPVPPTRAGYIFEGWVPMGGDGTTAADLKNIQSDMQVMAKYRLAQPGENDGTGSGTSPSPSASGSPNPSGSASPSPGTNGSASPSPGTNSSASPSPGAAGTFYTLTVQNGSGSGSYLEGSQPVIIANDPASGQEFDYWSVSPEDVKIASKVLSASIVTMPAKDVTVTAHYKAKTGSSGGGSTASGNSSQRPNGNSGVVSRGGTTVVIDKNGLSNTGVVSATVNGSSDNFTVKISESAEATEAALRALMAEYGDNLDNIKFFPMDISLYDSTGTTKITDTTGLSVSITLPLPDSLITYAGNNKVASVVNDRLERLSARFTTIQGVSCITFTAEHFSPYVIYVNTGDLSSGLVSDETPKTGDFIHPKWFLSIALACLSFVLFMQRDTKKPKKVKAKVRA